MAYAIDQQALTVDHGGVAHQPLPTTRAIVIRVFIHYAAVWFRSIVGRRRNRSRYICFVMHAARSVSAVLHVLNGRRVQ